MSGPFFSWHSHMIKTRQPKSSKAFTFSLSLATLRRSFSFQNSNLVLGIVA